MNYKSISNCIVGALFLISIQVHANGWAILSQHDQMKKNVIAGVGMVSKIQPPFNAEWEKEVYQINGHCFVLPGYSGYRSYSGKAALLLVNAQNIIQLALIQSEIGFIKVDLYSITMIECPAGSNIIPYTNDPEEHLKLLNKRQEELDKKLEEIMRRKQK